MCQYLVLYILFIVNLKFKKNKRKEKKRRFVLGQLAKQNLFSKKKTSRAKFSHLYLFV